MNDDRDVAELSLAQAASLLSGADMDTTTSLPEHDVPGLRMTDGSNGLAMNLPNFAGKVAATCYPTLSAMAATWDPELVGRVAHAIALDARAAGAGILLSPGMNLKRSPLGGRNFEYFSEDPHLTGELATAFVHGTQSADVAACVKHFAANNQETDRMRVSADVSERALREVYLRAFERVVTAAQPEVVMAAYNRINGVYATQNPWLLRTVLRDEWGFKGVVVSDWGAVDDRVDALTAGLDLEMPSSSGASDALVVEAVGDGRVPEAMVRESAGRIARLARRRAARAADSRAPLADDDAEALAQEAAERAAVLLSNVDSTLPLSPHASVAVIGALGYEPRFQGAGSAGVNARRTPAAIWEELRALHRGPVSAARGYLLEGDGADAALADEAAAVAAAADVAVVVVGLPEDAESEGFDRTTLALPRGQRELVERLAGGSTPVVVVLIAGGVVDLESWRTSVAAILFAGLAGQGVSRALARLLTGAVSPSGRLTETFPLDLRDGPSFLSFPGAVGSGVYGEDIFVGYRGYDELGRDVAYPFGHGLTYTEFAYRAPAVERTPRGWSATIEVQNTGSAPARELVQVYATAPAADIPRPPRELVGFASAQLEPGESQTLAVEIDERAFARWDTTRGWVTDAGSASFSFAKSSRDIVATVEVSVEAAGGPTILTPDHTLSEWLDHPRVGPLLFARVQQLDRIGNTIGLISDPTARLMIGGLPIKRLALDAGNVLSLTLLDSVQSDSDAEQSVQD
ncbi:MAG TPA: glycoside hydrolase family 3 N-terminal domain-containing protein [Microbacterium sp.]|nr:glycoside hydrolase family 3 N-terminal domain-containing protein [Microbacterium sp.]